MEIYHPEEKEVLREMRRVRRSDRIHRLAWGLLIFTVLAVAAGWFTFNRYFTLAEVRGPGMEETLYSGDLVLCRRTTAEEALRPGDLALYSHGGAWQIKRVIAAAGDRVVVSGDGEVRVNGTVIEESYAAGNALDTGIPARRINLDAGEIFVLGDERSLSVDSRSAEFGVVREEDVIGTAEYVLWPLYRARSLKQSETAEQTAVEGGSTP